MAIVAMMRNDSETFPEGAHCPLEYNRERKHGAIVVYEYAKGRVLREWESNGYHDSDFYCQYLDENDEIQTVMFATTRGWCYPCMATYVDATDEVRAIAQRIWDAAARRDRIQKRWNKRREDNALARRLNLSSRKELERIYHAFPARDYRKAALKLLETYAGGRMRSKFRISLAEQILTWARDASPKFKSPLSYKQMNYL